MSEEAPTGRLNSIKKEVNIGTNEFVCQVCNIIYQKGWSYAEAQEEYIDKFKEEISPTSSTVVLCDTCYKKMNP